MKLPNWAKILYWILLSLGLTFVLYIRSQAIVEGRATAFDLVAFVVWVALLLLPLFAEISLWGMTLKAHIDEAKKEINEGIAAIQNEIKNEVRTIISPNFYPPAPADSQLPKIEELVGEAVRNALQSSGASDAPIPTAEAIDGRVELLLTTRYQIERELRRIAKEQGLEAVVRGRPLHILLRALSDSAALDNELADAIRRVYSVCSPAVHGEDVSEAQVSFVRDVAPKLVSALRNLGYQR